MSLDPADHGVLDAPTPLGSSVAGVMRETGGLGAALDEVRRLLGVDSAVVLLLDETRTMLERVATSGLERTPRAGARIPLGRGFAGRIALTNQPLAIYEVSDQNVFNPLIHRQGIRSLLGVPLVLGQRLLGVLHVGSLTPRAFTAAEQHLLERVAAQLAPALRLRLEGEEHVAALVLQRSLLPSRLEPVPGLDIAGRYIPADGDLGGDWYDVFRLPGGQLGIVMGDVVGHGLAAAVVMGRLRSALRGYVLDTVDPAEVLRRLDRFMAVFEAGALATVTFGIAEPPYRQFAISSAGHLAPLLVRPGLATEQLDVPSDLLLGVDPSRPRHTSLVELPDGASLCLFTDGLVERRLASPADVDLMERGLAELIEALPPGDAETACTSVIDGLLGNEIAADDVALLVVHRPV